jgi:hypothetical protein
MNHRLLILLPTALAYLMALTGCNLIAPLLNAALPLAGIKFAFSCMPEHVMVDTPTGSQRVGSLTAGEMVIGYEGNPVRVLQKHTYMEDPATEFLTIRFSDGAEVEVCGMHRVAGVRARNLKPGDIVAGRRVVSVSRHSGEKRSCDLLTEDKGYRVGGVPVNSMIEEMHRAAVKGVDGIRD